MKKYLKKKDLSKKLSILIVGATGFVGSNLLYFLSKYNYDITAISKNSNLKIKKKNISHIKLDVSKIKDLKRKIKKEYDIVINLSGYVDHKNKKKVYDVHYKGAKNLINFFKDKNIQQFIQIGSSIEYGRIRSPHIEPKFLKKMNTFSDYGNAKYEISRFILELNKKKFFPFIILRPYIIYGPRQTRDRLIPQTIISCLKNKSFNCSEGTQSRDFIYISDFNELIKRIIDKKIRCEIFNVGTGKPKNVKKVIELIKKKIKKGKPIFGKIPLRKDEIFKLYPKITKAKKLLGWTPKRSLEQICLDGWNWQIKNPYGYG